jgi:hypothetical protein
MMPLAAAALLDTPTVGIGWRQPHYAGLLQTGPVLDCAR